MDLTEALEKLVEEKGLIFSAEPGKEDWFICTLKRSSGFIMFKEDVYKYNVRKWVQANLDFMNGKNKWVK